MGQRSVSQIMSYVYLNADKKRSYRWRNVRKLRIHSNNSK